MTQIRVTTILPLKRDVSNIIIRSLKADNVDFPEGLEMEIYANDNLTLIFTSSYAKMHSMINTIDEVLEHIAIVLNTIGDNDDRS